MNIAIIQGRLARDPELKTTQSGISVCNFTVACDRRVKTDAGTWDKTADFIPCVAWRGQADLVNQYFSKGDRILVQGSIQPRSWEDDEGNKRYMTEIQVREVEFCESGNKQYNNAQGMQEQKQEKKQETYMDDDDTSLPFDF